MTESTDFEARKQEKVYFSYPIQGGAEFWFVLKEFWDQATKEEKKDLFFSINQSKQFREKLNKIRSENRINNTVLLDIAMKKYPYYINPINFDAVFSGQGWESYDYLSVEKWLIINKIDKLVLIGEWYYSLGCWTEIAVARKNKKKIINLYKNGEIELKCDKNQDDFERYAYMCYGLLEAIGNQDQEFLKVTKLYIKNEVDA